MKDTERGLTEHPFYKKLMEETIEEKEEYQEYRKERELRMKEAAKPRVSSPASLSEIGIYMFFAFVILYFIGEVLERIN